VWYAVGSNLERTSGGWQQPQEDQWGLAATPRGLIIEGGARVLLIAARMLLPSYLLSAKTASNVRATDPGNISITSPSNVCKIAMAAGDEMLIWLHGAPVLLFTAFHVVSRHRYSDRVHG
jgi:hypothetical protein